MSAIDNDQLKSRRQFLTYVGAISSIAMLSACTVQIPVIQPETTAPSGQGEIMYARVVTNQLQPSKKDEWIAICRDSIVPALRQQKGFKGFVMLADIDSDKSIAYSMWETEADLKASETSGFYQEQVAKLRDVLAMPPVREIHELTVIT